jgi:hypothetical protein
MSHMVIGKHCEPSMFMPKLLQYFEGQITADDWAGKLDHNGRK